jgi:hypothetical protein
MTKPIITFTSFSFIMYLSFLSLCFVDCIDMCLEREQQYMSCRSDIAVAISSILRINTALQATFVQHYYISEMLVDSNATNESIWRLIYSMGTYVYTALMLRINAIHLRVCNYEWLVSTKRWMYANQCDG